jgi:hypothetical protein
MKNGVLTSGLAILLILASTAIAVPTLQLYVKDGYLPVEQQTLFTERDYPFDLIAYITTDNPLDLT